MLSGKTVGQGFESLRVHESTHLKSLEYASEMIGEFTKRCGKLG